MLRPKKHPTRNTGVDACSLVPRERDASQRSRRVSRISEQTPYLLANINQAKPLRIPHLPGWK